MLRQYYLETLIALCMFADASLFKAIHLVFVQSAV